MKKLLTLAAAAAIVAASALPATAATGSGTVTVQWNISVTAALTLATNYTGTGTMTPVQGTTGPPVAEYLQGSLGSSEACTAVANVAAATVDFGTITPDAGLAANTVCAVKQAIDAKVATNSINWTLGESLSAASTGVTLCGLSNSGNFPITVTGAASNVPASGRTAASLTDGNGTGTGTCSAAGELTIPTTASSTNMASSTTAYPTGTNLGEDLELITSPSASTGTQTKTLTVSLVAN